MRNKNGFTLMEVIVAIAVVAIVAGPLLQVFITSNRVGRNSYDVDHANAVAVKTVEKIIEGADGYDVSDVGNYTPYSYSDDGINYIQYTAVRDYSYNWEDSASGDATFSALITLSGVASGGEAPAYIPALSSESGSGYWLSTDYSTMAFGDYPLTVQDDGTNYVVTCLGVGLKKSTDPVGEPASGNVSIPHDDVRADVIPIVIYVDQARAVQVSFTVDNRTGLELAFYIYNDAQDPHLVTASITSGAMSTNYMKVSANDPTYSLLDANVKVTRIEGGDVLADYTTKLYFPQ